MRAGGLDAADILSEVSAVAEVEGWKVKMRGSANVASTGAGGCSAALIAFCSVCEGKNEETADRAVVLTDKLWQTLKSFAGFDAVEQKRQMFKRWGSALLSLAVT